METAACAPCPALPAPVTLLPRPAPQAQPDGSFVYREADALKFQEYYDGLGEECPLVPTRNSVKDKGKEALITVVPPIGITARPHAKQKARRPHDRKRLTLLGREALQRSSPTRTKGEAWKGTVVWKLEYQCRGTPLCDPATKPAHRGCRCDVRLVYSATVEQVDKELVRVEVTGVGGAGAISLHSRSMRWDPARLRAERGLREPARQAAVQEAERQARAARAEVIAEQRRAASAAVTTPASSSSASAGAQDNDAGVGDVPVETLAQARSTKAEGTLRVLKRAAQCSYPKSVRDGTQPRPDVCAIATLPESKPGCWGQRSSTTTRSATSPPPSRPCCPPTLHPHRSVTSSR